MSDTTIRSSGVVGAMGDGSDEPTKLLQVKNLTVDFLTDNGWATVVEDVTFDVGWKETVGIVGESGSGKTVTAMSVMGLIPKPPGRVSQGSIQLDETRLLDLSPRQLEDVRGNQMSMIFQEPMTSLNPAYTVGDQIAETMRRHLGISRSDAKQRAIDMLASVGIPNPAKRVKSYPHEFSGGMRQRVMISIALSCAPTLLIADEPTTALDVTVQAQVLNLLRRMKEEIGMSILFITHDLGVVADICDRVIVMYAGQVVEEAPVDDLFARPGHPYTDGLLRSMPAMAARTGSLHSIDGQPPMVGSMPEGCRFHPRCPYAIDACTTGPIPLIEIAPGRTSRCIRTNEIELGVKP